MALVIGNRSYPDNDAPFAEPVENARRIAQTLRQIGFDTAIGEDLTKDQMQSALDKFGGTIRPGSIVFFFFSGVGVQSAGHTYLVPIDAIIWSEQDVKTYGFNLDRILANLDGHGAKIRLVAIDGARRNPFERRFRTSGSAGLAPINAANETLAIYSHALGAAFDESTTAPGSFVGELIKEMEAPGALAENAFRRTGVGVSHLPQAGQRPWVNSTLHEDIALNVQNCGKAVGTGTVEAASPPTPTDRPSPPVVPSPLKAPKTAMVSPDAAKGLESKAVKTKPAADATLTQQALLEETRDRLFERNLDPGSVGSPEMADAIRAFQKQAGLPDNGTPTEAVLQDLREAEKLSPWGAIIFASDAGRWGMSWGRPSRRQALSEARARCGSNLCTHELSFFGQRCGAFALSVRNWAITWRTSGATAKKAALDDCAKRGQACTLVGAVCADGSERTPHQGK